MNVDIKIAQSIELETINKIAKKANVSEKYLENYGKYKAKINNDIYNDIKDNKDGKLILVTAINPTKAGEGKSTTTIGLTDGLALLNKNVIACLREPSLGPVFGLKGGATGGGYAQVVPMEDINLHFTGDMHAITTANNLVSAILDNYIYQENTLNIDPNKVVWNRCLDMNDRTLRNITIGQKKKTNGIEREDTFVITVATEIMAILCLSNDIKDFEEKVKKCIVAYTHDDKPVTIEDLKISGALAVIMKDALKPNLVQTLEHTPVFIHGGPFANIAHGCNSIIATKTALKLADYVVTEAGFGADLGAEKFLDIKCRLGNLKPDAIVIVATIRALKMHGGVDSKDIEEENIEALLKGCSNLEKHIESIKAFGLPFVVAINKFSKDTKKEVETIINWCKENNYPVEEADGWAQGGKGMIELANKVIDICNQENNFKPIYDLNRSIEEKIETISKLIYGADGVDYSDDAKESIKTLNKLGYDNLPICMAKTPMSLTDDPKKVGRPTGFNINVTNIKVSAGAGFIVVFTGAIMTMPGLPKHPAALDMGIDDNGKSYGIF